MSPRPVNEQEYDIINAPEPPAEMTNGDVNDNTVSEFYSKHKWDILHLGRAVQRKNSYVGKNSDEGVYH